MQSRGRGRGRGSSRGSARGSRGSSRGGSLSRGRGRGAASRGDPTRLYNNNSLPARGRGTLPSRGRALPSRGSSSRGRSLPLSRGRGRGRTTNTATSTTEKPRETTKPAGRFRRGGLQSSSSRRPTEESRNSNFGSGRRNRWDDDDDNYGRSSRRSYNDDSRRSYGNQGNDRQSSYSSTQKQAKVERSTKRDPAYEAELFSTKHSISAGINFDAYDQIEGEVSGRNAPEPFEDWTACKFPSQIRYNLAKCNFKKPTPIQKYSVPCVMNFRNVMACAQTGSGKTAAFLVPTIANLMQRDDPRESMDMDRRKFYPRVLVFSPTRELAQQIHVQAKRFLYCTGNRAVCVYGGEKIWEQFKTLEGGVDVLLATPGRLNDMIERGRMSMEAIQFLILDEADRMLDMGFEPQIRQIVEGADMPPKEKRTTLMFSATFPRKMQEMAADFMDDYVFIAIGRVGAASDLVKQSFMEVDRHDKERKIVELLKKLEGQILVFMKTKRSCDNVDYVLGRNGIKCDAIHGDKSQGQREYVLKSFKEGKTRILVATDVASRGLDIPNVAYVVQVDLPDTIDDYVHRIGRTGRCGNKGNAMSFVNSKDRIVGDIYGLLEEQGKGDEQPEWFRSLAKRQSRYGSSSGRKGGSKFGGRDYRNSKRDRW